MQLENQGYAMHEFSGPLDGGEKTFEVYVKGDGAPVVLIQELPGIGKETLALADNLINAGFQVHLPHLFGPLGRRSMIGNTFRVFCMRREFSLFSRGKTSPIVNWLTALCRDIKNRTGASGVGAIGMCLTGNIAISLMADDAVLAAVSSQPSLPLQDQNALHMSPEDVAKISARLDTHGPMHAFRFERDTICKAEKFEALDKAFNTDRERIKLTTLPGPGHSVLTVHFVDEDGHPTREALNDVISYFREKLAA